MTVFVNMDKKKESVIFATEGRDSSVVEECKDFIEEHNGEKENVEEVVCDMSKPFLKGFQTMTGYQIKEKLSWIRGAKTLQGAKWRIRRFINYLRELIKDQDLLEPMAKALDSLEKHGDKVVERWRSGKTSARLEGLNSIFQAVRARARGYRNTETFLMMIYLSPVAATLKST